MFQFVKNLTTSENQKKYINSDIVNKLTKEHNRYKKKIVSYLK